MTILETLGFLSLRTVRDNEGTVRVEEKPLLHYGEPGDDKTLGGCWCHFTPSDRVITTGDVEKDRTFFSLVSRKAPTPTRGVIT